MIRSLYEWTLRLAARPYALWALFGIAFIESSVFPIPPDIMLIPMVLAARDRAFLIAAVCTAGSVIGGWLGYYIGAALWDAVALPVLEFYRYADKIDLFRDYYQEWGGWAVFIAGVTPVPYKVATIVSGALDLDPATFTVASVLSRGLRFVVVAGLLYYFGAPIKAFIEKNLNALGVAFVVLLLGGFLAVKFLL